MKLRNLKQKLNLLLSLPVWAVTNFVQSYNTLHTMQNYCYPKETSIIFINKDVTTIWLDTTQERRGIFRIEAYKE